MSRKSWGRGLLEILRSMGVSIDKTAEETIAEEKEAAPHSSTADIVQRLSLAPPEVIEKALQIAKDEGSMELLEDRLQQATEATRESRRASIELTQVASRIAKG